MRSEYITHSIIEHEQLIEYFDVMYEDIIDIEYGNDINGESYFSKITVYSMPI